MIRLSKFKLVELEPLDTVFFGDARGMEFNVGGRSLRLPLPWTVSGALLTHYLVKTGRVEDLSMGCDDSGECESEERGEATVFAFYGPFIHYGGTYWFTAPADLVALKKTSLSEDKRCWPTAQADLSAGEDEMSLVEAREGGEGYARYMPLKLPLGSEPYGMVDHEFLERYADGEFAKPKKPENFDFEERRVGIHIDDGRRTVKTGFTFSSIHRRPRPGLRYAMLLAEKLERGFSFSGLVRLGGEGRAAIVYEREWMPSWLSDRRLEAGTKVKAVLISPAIYRRGEFDSRIPDLQGLPGSPEILKLGDRPLVIGGKALMVSGWDMRTGRARKMYSAVPPGTVYYLKLKEDANRLDLTLSFWRLSLFWERGFGSPLLGVIP